MTLHPQAVEYCRALEAENQNATALSINEQRALARSAALAVGGRRALDRVTDLVADGVGCRLYRPRDDAPVALYVHGGGWVLHDLETHDDFCRYLSGQSGWALLAVDYRRAPEHPHPAPLDDVETAARWLRAHATRLGVDASFLPGIGDSSGANLVAGLLVRDPTLLDFQVLLYPPVEADADAGGSWASEGNVCLQAADMRRFWAAYAPGRSARHPEVSPLRADNLAQHPPAFILSAEHDILRDQAEAYAHRLMQAGVEVQAYRALGMVHSFWRQPQLFDASRAAVRDVTTALNSFKAAAR